MQKIILILVSIFIYTACKNDKKTIEFKRFSNIDLGNIAKENATLHATAVFMNYSEEEINLKDLVLDFAIDDKDIGTIVTKEDKVIKANAEFSIPIKYTYETNSFVEAGHDPSSTYTIKLSGDLTTKDAENKELTTAVKYSSKYEYHTKKERREEKRETRKEERQKRRAERKANKNN